MFGPRQLALLSLGLSAASLGCGRSGPPGAAAQGAGPPAMPVKIEVARAVAIDDASEYVAALKSRASAAIMPQVEGRITQIFVRSGARVTAGTPLLQIDPAKQQATVQSQQDTLAAKRAALAYARQQHQRVAGLHAAGISSQQDLDQARTALDAAQAELEALEAQLREQQVELRYYSVDAPTDGIVGDIPVRVGDSVTTATELTTVDRPGELEAYLSVPVERAAQLRLGLPVEIMDAAGQLLAKTSVTFLSPRADDATQTVLAKARIPNETRALRPAQFVRARVVWDQREGPVVPVLAVSRISGNHFAFVAESQDGALVARQRQLRVGQIVGNDYQVLEGIAVGERVIVSGTQFLVDGAPVSPQG